MMKAAECRELANYYRAKSKETGASERKTSLLKNISRSLSGLASQLEMREAHEQQ